MKILFEIAVIFVFVFLRKSLKFIFGFYIYIYFKVAAVCEMASLKFIAAFEKHPSQECF